MARPRFFELQANRRTNLANQRAARYDQELFVYLQTIKHFYEPEKGE